MNVANIIDQHYPHHCRPGARHFPVYVPTGREPWLIFRPPHPENRPQGSFTVHRPAVFAADRPPKTSPTREWILQALAGKPEGISGAQIQAGSKIFKGAFDAMIATMIRAGAIEICGNRRHPDGGRIARVYRLTQFPAK